MNKPNTQVNTVGLDISDKYLQAYELTHDGEVVDESRFRCSEEKLRERYEGAERKRFIVEMSSSTRWIAVLLEDCGHEVIIVDPRRFKVISQSLKKDDRNDAATLAFYGQTIPKLLPTVQIRDLKHQKALTLVRARAAVVEARTKLVNTVRGLLKPYGVRVPKGGSHRTFATYIRENVEPELAKILEPLLWGIDHANQAVKSYNERVEEVLSALAPHTMHLTQIQGVGALTVLYFVALIGDPSRFSKSRDVGAYLGLCPRRHDSGEFKAELGITKTGDPYMRALLSNCAAHILGPFGVDSDLRRWGVMRIGGGAAVPRKTRPR